MFENFDLDWNIAGVAALFYIIFMFLIWMGPEMVGMKGWDMTTKIVSTVALIPMSYLIVNYIINNTSA